MKTIREQLLNVPEDRIAIRGKTNITFGELVRSTRQSECALAGHSIALRFSDLSIALRAIIMLDGRARRLMLISSAMDMEVATQLATLGECDVTLGDAAREANLDTQMARYDLPQQSEALHGDLDSTPGVETEWILSTSGTSGESKLVCHSLASLTRTTGLDIERGRETRWGLLYDWTRFAGLQVVLQALLSGASLIVPNRDATLDEQILQLVERGCTHLSATPTFWRKLLMTSAAKDMSLKQVTLGGEIADQRILNALHASYPNARITHIFASTEAGVGFAVSDAREGFPASFLADPPKGIRLRVESGRLFIANSAVQPKYVSTSRTFVTADGFVDTGDIVERAGDRFLFLGRDSGTVNVGGNKVHPEQIERVLLAHPGVLEGRAYGRPNPITGAIVVAEIVAARDSGDSRTLVDSIRTHCRNHLERFQIPAIIKIVKELQLNASGKLARDNP